MPQYRRLTQADRHRIEARHRDGELQSEIAQKLGCSASTISRELGRNSGGRGYRSLQAQSLAERRKKRCRRKFVISRRIASGLHESLLRGVSPELFSGREQQMRGRGPSTSTCYRYAKAEGWSRNLLPRSGRRGAGRFIQRKRHSWKVSIASRPKGVAGRRTFGHWERDTLHAANGRLVLVLLERKSRYILIAPLKKRTAAETETQTRRLLRKTTLPKRTMTNDNGQEFNHAAKSKLPTYFCDPRKPQQRGSIENVNGLLRRYLTRTTDIDQLSDCDFRQISKAINDRPRKCLGFRTAAEVMRAQRLR